MKNAPAPNRGPAGLTTASFSSPGLDGRRQLEVRMAALTLANGLTVLIIADGIGRDGLGQRAAGLTVEAILSVLGAANGEALSDIPALLAGALRAANEWVWAASQRDPQKRPLGSTAAVGAVYGNRLYVANAGDSRIYHVRGHKATQVTVDHTWGYEVVKAGRAGPDRAFSHARAGEVTRSIGAQAELKVDLGLYLQGGALGGEADEVARQRNQQGLALQPGDFILGCSDGLVKARQEDQGLPYDQRRPGVSDVELAIQLQNNPPDRAVQTLVDLAVRRDTNDAVGAAVIRVPANSAQSWLAASQRSLFLAAGAGLALILAGVVFIALQRPPAVVQSAPAPETSAGQVVVSEVRGRVEAKDPQDPRRNSRAVTADVVVDMGQEIVSLADGTAKLLLAPDVVLWLGPNSDVTLGQGAGGTPEVQLLHGQVLLTAAPPGRPGQCRRLAGGAL